MSIQLPSIRLREGRVTASGIHVVPDPILSMLTPTGPIIMSSAERCCIPGVSVCVESVGLDGIGIPAMLGVFVASAFGAGCTVIPSISLREESARIGAARLFAGLLADTDFLLILGVPLRTPGFFALVFFGAFFFLVFLPIDVFMGICIVPAL